MFGVCRCLGTGIPFSVLLGVLGSVEQKRNQGQVFLKPRVILLLTLALFGRSFSDLLRPILPFPATLGSLNCCLLILHCFLPCPFYPRPKSKVSRGSHRET